MNENDYNEIDDKNLIEIIRLYEESLLADDFINDEALLENCY
mgnify:CR=1 FL=1